MSNDKEFGFGGGRDLTMKTALYVARVIHYDLVYANASAWQWWRSVGNNDYKDGLIYVDAEKTNLDGKFTDSKLMWAIGNYSRFIRPGARRVEVSGYNKEGKLVPEGETDPYAIMISAYQNTDGTPVVVAINYNEKESVFDLEWKGQAPKTWTPFCTNDKQGADMIPLEPIKNGKQLIIPGRSIVTYVGVK
jgi:hypothetical protein